MKQVIGIILSVLIGVILGLSFIHSCPSCIMIDKCTKNDGVYDQNTKPEVSINL